MYDLPFLEQKVVIMLKIIFSILFTMLVSLNAFSAEYQRVPCHPKLQKYWTAIQSVPEARELISKIQKEGQIRVTISEHHLASKFGAFWDMQDRVICINLAAHRSEGEIIGSILFDLHNALSTSTYDHIDYLAASGMIDRENYIQSFEHTEYLNSKSAASIAQKGIQMGVFPRDARLPTYDSFEEHYHYQKIGGHSDWIGRSYDQLITEEAYTSQPQNQRQMNAS